MFGYTLRQPVVYTASSQAYVVVGTAQTPSELLTNQTPPGAAGGQLHAADLRPPRRRARHRRRSGSTCRPRPSPGSWRRPPRPSSSQITSQPRRRPRRGPRPGERRRGGARRGRSTRSRTRTRRGRRRVQPGEGGPGRGGPAARRALLAGLPAQPADGRRAPASCSATSSRCSGARSTARSAPSPTSRRPGSAPVIGILPAADPLSQAQPRGGRGPRGRGRGVPAAAHQPALRRRRQPAAQHRGHQRQRRRGQVDGLVQPGPDDGGGRSAHPPHRRRPAPAEPGHHLRPGPRRRASPRCSSAT